MTAVWVARSAGRAAALVARLRASGVDAVAAPVIERAPADDHAPLDAAARAVAGGEYRWVVVTSVNAVGALHDAARRAGVDLARAATRWAAVGPATRSALEDVGVRVDLLPADDDATAAGLVAAFPPPGPAAPHRVLLPLGDLASPTLARGLSAAGWAPNVVTAYRTVRHELAPDVARRATDGGFDLVVVASGSAAREVARQVGTGTPVVAIGGPSAAAAREAGLTVAAVAATPTDDGLAAAVATALPAATSPALPAATSPALPAATSPALPPTSASAPTTSKEHP
ncbi:uroporphyrinogen-III synthase [Isoptericola sp. NEAU-Y5]|uniref:Uroporphyrinogen-III synthase n=1 Tax=Isoptericola luteus TaxID=2879484 RepID=A0ABS7ZHK6_9MICO|nr:uroporphyrinogen-III synthase [Isoptericola sp. NEAU-Y5]MCA5894506.1 uroporphyrinogen-III synthase [Isoptericola sp. NEAU-Y5]